MNPNFYDRGNSVIVHGSFRKAGAAVDPVGGVCELRIRWADGTEETIDEADLDHPSTGEWEYEIVPPDIEASSGDWAYRFRYTGSNYGAAEHRFVVRASVFA